MSYVFSVLIFFGVWSSTVSIMTRYVEAERVAGERRMEALFAKKTEILCPGYTQKGMSLCVRQYIKNYKVETASSYSALTNFIQIAANQDRNAKIYDASTAQLISFETLVNLQEQLKKENMICQRLKPSGPQHLLEVKQICAAEEEQFRALQETNKKYIQKKLEEVSASVAKETQFGPKAWKIQKQKEISRAIEVSFAKTFFNESQYKITDQDILRQNQTAIKVSCENLDAQYKNQFNQQNPCELKFSQLMLSCVSVKEPRHPASLKPKELLNLIQSPLPCFYGKVQEFIGQSN
jgi:hypothetical protein